MSILFFIVHSQRPFHRIDCDFFDPNYDCCMKENDGKARRRKWQKVVGTSVGVSILLVISLNNSSSSSHERLSALTNTVPHPNDPFDIGAKLRTSQSHRKDQAMMVSIDSGPSTLLQDEHFHQIFSASANLVALEFADGYSIKKGSYHGVVGVFCPLTFQIYKNDPPGTPMFRQLVEKSHCSSKNGKMVKGIRIDLRDAVKISRKHDSAAKNLELKGVVFHESRCGSTLASNSLVALNPEKHRVYSESTPSKQAMKACGEDFSDCSAEAAANLLKDVIYMMGRSNDPREEYFFFKFQSATTRTMEAFRIAFPITPWIFIYRDPVHVMVSQLDVPRLSMANCVESKNSSPLVKKFARDSGHQTNRLKDEDFCAIHLATLCESALNNLKVSYGLGLAVKYTPQLVDTLLESIFPNHFQLAVDDMGRDRVHDVAGVYSKNSGRHDKVNFVEDSERKERNASKAIKSASKAFLQNTFEELERFQFNILKL